MARKLRLALTVSALALTLASLPAQADPGGPRQPGSGGFLSRLVALFAPYEFLDAFNEGDGEDPATREGGQQGRGYIDPNGTDVDKG